MTKLSAFIITKNEALRIAAAINSIKTIVDELIVIDSGSTDDTVQIAESLGAKVIYQEWLGYVKQKAFAENLCKNQWILNIDADEELTKELRDEIGFIFSSNLADKYYAYQINFVILHHADIVPRFFAPANKFIRVYNRKFCSFSNVTNSTTHDAVLFNESIVKTNKIYDLNGSAFHRSTISIRQLVDKANFYSTEQANDMILLSRKPSKIRIIFEIPIWFLKAFIIRRYFVFGFDGFIYSMIFAFARFLKLAKANE